MQFLSLEFTLGLALLFLLYWIIPRRKWQNFLLLVASLGMVSYFGWNALLVLVVSTFLEWVIALKMGKTSSPPVRKKLLWLSVILNLSQLAFFKYSEFFIPEVSRLLFLFGIQTKAIHILMPVGLSFWTLQKMTLTLDVFYKRKPSEKNFFRALIFTSFFPCLLSGPIEYSRKLLPQLEKDRKWNTQTFSEGVWLFAVGAFLKAVLADNVAVSAEALLGPGSSGISVLIGIWAYALQIFGDFAGYSYMARGCARFLGIDITQNFLAPYLMRNLSDFWKHWHISLSAWLNEFIFSPLSLKLRNWGTASIVIAVWVTFVTSGLWHGTGLTFFVYGCIHALGITLFTLSKSSRKKMKDRFGSGPWLGWMAVALTFNWVCFGYLFFRAGTLSMAFSQIHSLFLGSWNPLTVSCDWTVFALSALAVFGLQAMVLAQKNVFWIFEKPVWFRVLFYLILGFLLLRCYAPSDRFIYFQF